MSFGSSILSNLLLLAGIVGVIFMAIFTGMGLSESDGSRMLLGLGMGIAGAVVLFVSTRLANRAG